MLSIEKWTWGESEPAYGGGYELKTELDFYIEHRDGIKPIIPKTERVREKKIAKLRGKMNRTWKMIIDRKEKTECIAMEIWEFIDRHSNLRDELARL